MCINGPLYTYRISANIFLRWTVSAVWWDNYEFKFAFYEKKIIDETTLYEIFLTLSNKFVLRGHCLRKYGMLYYEQQLDCILNNGILLPKLFWRTVRKNYSSDSDFFLKFEAEGREFAKILRSLEQFIQTVKGQNNCW